MRETSEVLHVRVKAIIQKAFDLAETIDGAVSVTIERQVRCPEPEKQRDRSDPDQGMRFNPVRAEREQPRSDGRQYEKIVHIDR